MELDGTLILDNDVSNGTFDALPVLVTSTCLLTLLVNPETTDGLVERQNLEAIFSPDEKFIAIKMEQSQNVQFTNMKDYLASNHLTTLSNKEKNADEFTLDARVEEKLFGTGGGSSDKNWLISLNNVGTLKMEKAVEDKNGDLLKLLVRLGADVNEKNNFWETPLHRASSSPDKAFALNFSKFLIDSGANACAQDKHGRTFLHKLMDRGSMSNPRQLKNLISNGTELSSSEFLDITEYLIENDLYNLFNVQENSNGKTPLMLAARNVELDVATISLLETNGVDLSLVDENGASYLSYAAVGSTNIKLLADLTRNGSIKLKHDNLLEAIKAMDGDSVKVIVNLGTDVNEKNDEWKKALHVAAKSKNKAFAVNIIKFLIHHRANVDDRYDDKTFMHRLVEDDRFHREGNSLSLTPTQFHDIATFLISQNLSRLFNAHQYYEATPLRRATEKMEIQTDTLTLLKNNEINFNAVDNHGVSILGWAIRGNRTLRLISDLVDHGANPKHLDTEGRSMLHFAAWVGRVDLLEYFMKKGLEVNAQIVFNPNLGATPLHFALMSSSKENVFDVVRFLLKSGANTDIVNDEGETPRDYFNEHRDEFPDADKISTCFTFGSAC